MNKFKKYCPNVWVAECDDEYEKGDTIELETKYSKTVECEVYNLIGKTDEKFFILLSDLMSHMLKGKPKDTGIVQ